MMQTMVDFRFEHCKAHCWGLGCGVGIDRELKGPQKKMGWSMVNDSSQELGQVLCSLVHTAGHQSAHFVHSGLQVEPSESGSCKSVLLAVRSAVSGVYCTLPVVVATVNGMDSLGGRPFHYYCKQ